MDSGIVLTWYDGLYNFVLTAVDREEVGYPCDEWIIDHDHNEIIFTRWNKELDKNVDCKISLQ